MSEKNVSEFAKMTENSCCVALRLVLYSVTTTSTVKVVKPISAIMVYGKTYCSMTFSDNIASCCATVVKLRQPTTNGPLQRCEQFKTTSIQSFSAGSFQSFLKNERTWLSRFMHLVSVMHYSSSCWLNAPDVLRD